MFTKGTYLIQTLPVEGKGGLLEGGYKHTMTAKELLDLVRSCHGIPKNKPLKIIGVGATESLGDEITYMGDKLYLISGENGKIQTHELDPKTKISFSQVALQPKEGPTKTVHFDSIAAPNSEKDTHEINHGGAFGELQKKIGDVSSSVVNITAKTKYIKSRAVCPIVKETGKKISPAVDLNTMIKGGTVENENGTCTITPQTILEQSFDYPKTIGMVGIVTGRNMVENVILKGLHLHCQYGHVLDLGDLSDVIIEVTPVTKTFIMLSKKDNTGKSVWHTALQEEDLPSLIKFQQLFEAWLKRKKDPKALEIIQEDIRRDKHNITKWLQPSKSSHVTQDGDVSLSSGSDIFTFQK
jgi:hypothetical protein